MVLNRFYLKIGGFQLCDITEYDLIFGKNDKVMFYLQGVKMGHSELLTGHSDVLKTLKNFTMNSI